MNTIIFFAIFSMAYADPRVQIEEDASSGIRGLPLGWTTVGRSPSQQVIQLMFAVKQTHLKELESTLLQVSDPKSQQYGQHLSNEAVHALVAPQQTHISQVKKILDKYGIVAVSLTPNSDILQADVTVKQAEELLSTKYYELHHDDLGFTVHRCMQYSLPTSIVDAIDFVAPTVHIPKPRRTRKINKIPGAVTNGPKVLRDLYSVDVIGRAPKKTKWQLLRFLTNITAKVICMNFGPCFVKILLVGREIRIWLAMSPQVSQSVLVLKQC